MSQASAFTGSVPKTYHAHLGPLLFEPYAKDITARLAPRENHRILELACGTCIVTQHIARAMPPTAKLTATDLNDAMIDVARASFAADPRVTLQKADASSLPFLDRSFDVVVAQYGVMFFPDKVGAMKEARRVLAPGGKYLFNVWDSLQHNPIPRIVQETLTRLLPDNPPHFLAKLPYGWFDDAEIQRTVLAGGFTRCEIETVSFPSIAPTAEDAARGFIEGTPVLAALAERGITDPTPFRHAAAKALAETLGNAPCTSTMRALVVTAS